MSDAQLSISKAVLLSELDAAQGIIARWNAAVKQGIPLIDHPDSYESFVDFVREMRGELLLVAGKCDALSLVLGESIGLG
jgi:hypothetical protein